MIHFYGIQKLSLVDFDTEVSCTLFTRGCNFRCPFCHNFEFVTGSDEDVHQIDDEDILDYLKSKVNKLTGVVITGGEPTIQKDLVETVQIIKNLGYKIKLDTNGTNPEVMINLIEKHLIDYVAVDIKNSPEMYSINVGVDNLDLSPIKKTVDYLISHDFPYEFRTTLIDEWQSIQSITAIGKWLKGAKKLFLQHFEESEYVPDKTLHAVNKEKTLEYQRLLQNYIDDVEIRGFN